MKEAAHPLQKEVFLDCLYFKSKSIITEKCVMNVKQACRISRRTHLYPYQNHIPVRSPVLF